MTEVKSIVHFDDDDNLIVERQQDCQPILDEVRLIKSHSDGWSESRELVHVGRIPAVVVEHYCNTKGITFRDFLMDEKHTMNILNDPDLSKLRIAEGRIL